MWDLGNRSVITLVSVLSGCVFLYNVWGPILILTISLFLTIYACYSLIVNDSLLSPHAFLLFDYCKHISLEVCASVQRIVKYIYEYIRQFRRIVSRRFRERNLTQFRMERRRGTRYQLSDDTYSTRSNSSSFGSIAQLSPISKDVQKADISNNISPKNKYYHNSGHPSYDHSPLGNHTVMPMFPRNKEELENQTFGLLSPNQSFSKKLSPAYRQNHALAREDSMYYNSEGSMWDTGVSPKMDTSINELRGAQAIGGPLLSSTRYNIDQRIYNDVNSPGLTTRLTKYAAEANNKLMHQSQYRVGQFPKVNLHASPVPLINAKSVRPKTPVTVRVAPPHTIRYSPPSKQKIFSNSHHPDNSYSSPSVTQSLREISLKRHASREERYASDPVKKQRTESLINEEFESPDETKQKRSREEESLKSEEDASPQSKAESTNRPTKRTKTPSCYDIINSLSSSKHVVSGVKRKARDFSRSGTPDFEKHFKSLESIQNNSSPSLPQVPNVSPKCPDQEVPEKRNSNEFTPPDKIQEQFPLRGILKSTNKSVETDPDNKEIYSKRLNAFDKNDRLKEPVVSTDTGKLTHKLFMRAEPERNEKLRMLVEEQGNIRAKFTTDDVEEIKKEDIADMRQTSMKARLQSMFDAISGKAASQINPDVVIQAEEVNPVKPVECPVTCATLNSSTTTTNVNTTPISTSAVAPSFGVNETSTKNTKHVAFNLPNKEVSSNANIQPSNTFEAQTKSVPPSTGNQTSNAPGNMFTTTSTIMSHSPATNVNVVNSSSTTPNFNFGTSTPSTATSTSSSTLFTPNVVSSSNNVPSLATSTTTSLFGNVASNVSMSSPVPVISSTTNAKTEASLSFPTNVPQTMQNVSTSSNLSVGSGNMTAASTSANIAPSLTTFVAQSTVPSTGSTSITSNMNAIPLRMTSSMNVSSSAPAPVIPSLATIRANMEMISKQSVPWLTFGNKTGSPPAPKPKGFSFGSVGNVSQSGNTFGFLANSQQVQSTNTNTGTSTTTSTSMNGPALQSSSASNVVINSTAPNLAKTMAATFTTPAISTFSFRAPNPSESNKTGFSFNNAPSATKAPTGSSSTPAFSTGNNNALPSFGSLPASNPVSTAANNPPQFTMNANPIFGNASTSSIFGTTTPSQSIFGTPSTTNVTSTTFAAPKSSATPMFGSNVNTTSSAFANMNTAPVFSNTAGGSSSGGTTCTLAVPVFGSAANTSAPSAPATTGSLFSGANSTSSAPAFGTTSNIFGQVTSSSATFKNTTGVFGSNSSTPNLFRSPTTTTSTFGTTNVASSSNTSVPVFGSANTSSNVPAPAFGTTSTVTPVFGSQNTANSATPGTTAPTFGTSTNIFGSSSSTGLPAYGSNTGSPFGSSASSTFGGQNPSTSNAFGATSNVNANANVNATSNANVTNANTNASSVPAFGDNKVLPFGAQSSTFGSSSAPNTAFGPATNANNENNNAGSIFSFGANQKQPQQNTAFSFGSGNNNANNNATTSSSAPFQFSGAPSNLASTGGFNFSAPTTTPSINFGTTSAPTFNATAPGMFSIGSGFTAPRSRTARSRKPR